MEIPVGKMIVELLSLRREAKAWDPNEQMPWSKTEYVKDTKGQRYKVEVKLNPKEEVKDANL